MVVDSAKYQNNELLHIIGRQKSSAKVKLYFEKDYSTIQHARMIHHTNSKNWNISLSDVFASTISDLNHYGTEMLLMHSLHKKLVWSPQAILPLMR